MSDLIPPRVGRMIPYQPGKPLEELERELGITNAIKLASNENPLGPSPRVIEAVAQAAKGLGFYPDGAAFDLRSALAERHGVALEEVVLGNGSNELIDLACRTFPNTEAGDHCVFGKPSFVCYWLGCTAAGVDFTEVPLRDNLHWDLEAMAAAVTEKTKLLFLANPNNPTGAYVGKDALERFLTELPERVVVVMDEAYYGLPDAEDYASGLELRHTRERLLTFRTFSKTHGIAGLRVGYAVGPAPLVDALNRMRAPFNVSLLGQIGALAALKDEAHVERYIAMNRTERARVSRALGELGLAVAPSQANFVLVDFERPGAEVYDALLRDGVIVRPMPPPIETSLRITIGTPEQNDRMLAAVAKLQKGA
jgi:histidinol-phosphate aminotransferase